MVSFGVIGFLVLILIYFVVRNQGMQRELTQLKHTVKSIDTQSKFSLSALLMLSGQIQKTYQVRLESLQKHALINNDDYEIAHFILSQVEFVIMQCCEQRSTVEEAINKALDRSTYDIEQINQFVARQPSEVRVPWCKNSIGGFVSACHNLTSEKLKLKSRKPDLRQETDKSEPK